jgi:hypothetical protein
MPSTGKSEPRGRTPVLDVLRMGVSRKIGERQLETHWIIVWYAYACWILSGP